MSINVKKLTVYSMNKYHCFSSLKDKKSAASKFFELINQILINDVT